MHIRHSHTRIAGFDADAGPSSGELASLFHESPLHRAGDSIAASRWVECEISSLEPLLPMRARPRPAGAGW